MSNRQDSLDRMYWDFMCYNKDEMMNYMTEQQVFDLIYHTFADYPEYMVDCVEEIEATYECEIEDAKRQLKKFGKMKKQFQEIRRQHKVYESEVK